MLEEKLAEKVAAANMYKSFREQFLECKKNGICKEEKCHCCGQTLLMCYKYGGFCHSGKCRKERIKE